MTGANLGGSAITVVADPTSTDGTKVTVTGFGPQVEWQELKDLFKTCGAVMFADVKGKPGKGKGGGGWGGGGCGFGMGFMPSGPAAGGPPEGEVRFVDANAAQV